MKLNIGIPENGWLPIEFISDEFYLYFTTSKIPKNPTDEFCQNLILSAQDLKTKTTFNIESHFYYFNLYKNNKGYNFEIEFDSIKNDQFGNTTTDKEIVFSKTGTFKEIILPLYRGLKKFTTLEYQNKDWTRIDEQKLTKLSNIISEGKTAHNIG